MDNNRLLEERVNKMELVRIKLLSIKQFIGERLKLKSFLMQIHFKITQEAVKLPTPID